MGYFQQSGKIDTRRTINAAFFAVAFIIIVSLVHALFKSKTSFIYAHFVLILIAVGAIHISVKGIILYGRIRNNSLKFALAIPLIIIFLIFSWSSYTSLILNESFGSTFSNIFSSIRRASIINLDTNLSEKLNKTVSGNGNLFVWGIETLVLVGGTIASIVPIGKHLLFCESCNKWTNNTIIVRKKSDEKITKEIIENWLQEKDFSTLEKLNTVTENDENHYRFIFNKCAKCDSTMYLKVEEKYFYATKNAQFVDGVKTIFPYHALNLNDLSIEIAELIVGPGTLKQE